ncbi:MAG: DUF1176 domain-containing protein [Pseudomonadota bacterium]
MSGFMKWSAVLLSSTAMFAAASAQAQGLSQSARDWWVTCDDDRYCIAETAGKSTSDSDMKLKLERSNKPDGRIFVTVNPGHKLTTGMRVDIAVLGTDYEAGGEIKKVYKGNEMAFSEKPGSELVKKLREGSKGQVTVKFGGEIGTVVYSVSLSGVTTALLLMDEVQRRLDRVDAAVATGGEPSNSPSAEREAEGDEVVGENGHEDQSEEAYAAANTPPENPQINDFSSAIGSGSNIYSANDLPEAVIMPGFRSYNCDMDGPMQSFGAKVMGMGSGNVIYLIPCQTGDVNIEHYVAVTGPNHGNFANTYEFELPIDFNQPNRTTIISPSFDPQSGTLTSITYNSSNYDCGIFEKHQYVQDGDYFELIEYREKTDCDGITGPPEGFPLIWTIDEMGQ